MRAVENAFERRPMVAKLADGPCADTYVTVMGWGEECYQRLGPREQVWLRYVKNHWVRGEYVWSGEAITEEEFKRKIHNDKQNTYGATQGA